MKITTEQLADARETLTSLLDEIGIAKYVFEVEPQEGQWGVNIECEIEEGWERFELTASSEYLVRGKDDAVLHKFFLEEWGDALGACKKRK